MANEMPKVNLAPAHSFVCPFCDETRFIEAVLVEFNEEELAAYREEYPDETFERGQWRKIPDVVTCEKCQCDFEVDEHWVS